MTLIDTEVATIRRLKRQRADVRRSITTHAELVLHADTKTVGLALDDVLRATERRLTEALNEASARLRRMRALNADFERLALEMATEGDPHAAIGGAS
jgi:hypothetical protein